jgi:hypothetical protein
MTLTQLKKYQATIPLQGVEIMASNAMILEKLMALGFVNVSVTGMGKQRLAQGTWGKDTVTGPLPAQAKKYIQNIIEL